ncbi:AraC family transcriptional regulator [Echinicola marina]|uniref:helix-turn-helix domain-containing protein n=1 Tax=Echinicola marina TaxID=2859768 RepID=UPI001CF6157F|nr:AraC family transcriptional regulator [Echinicola marina]UCS92763.1 AraC family transcriptional regulator [Echinicola marina]
MEFTSNKKLAEEQLLKVSRMKPVIKPTKPHKHAGYHELIFLFQGAGHHTIGDETFEVHPPTGFYLGPGQVHCWDFSKIPDGFVILFKEEVLSLYPKAQNYLFNFPKHFDIVDKGDFFKMLEEFYREFKAGENLDILAAFLNLLVLKGFEYSTQSKQTDPKVANDFSLFKSLLNEHFIELKSAEDYAKLMGISVKKLNKTCQSAVNATAKELIKERVLMEAKNLLTHTNNNVSEIAHLLNFTDSSNFVKFFKSSTTLTPMDYRSRANTQ